MRSRAQLALGALGSEGFSVLGLRGLKVAGFRLWELRDLMT